MRTLTLRELNRTVLARQMLLERESIPVPAAVEKLVGMQAQAASAPFIGLWTRLNDFTRDELAALIEKRVILKATLMRGTLHLFTTADYLRLRGAVQPALDTGWEAITKKRGDFGVDAILNEARVYLETPRSFAEISEHFSALMPETDIGAIRYTIRTQLPLVQVPTETRWCYPGNPKFMLAETWLGQPVPMKDDFKTLVFRYLAAFGPATVADIQTWSGLAKIKDALETLKPELMVYKDEKKRDLFDLPDMLIVDADAPAPVRFLPEFDNLLLSHTDRRRVLSDDYRAKVFQSANLRVSATFLVDGFVAGRWKVEKKKKTAALLIEEFEPLTKENRAALTDDAEKLIRFIENDATSYEVHFEA